jgi:Flp pilus assembly protein TadD
MSLLMKALEKAAQDRNKSADQPSAAATAAATERSALSLEPLAPSVPSSSSSGAAVSARRVDVAAAPKTSAVPGAAGPATRTSSSHSSDQARAAVLLSTQQPARGTNVVAWIGAHPVHFTAALAGVFALGYAVYLYLQIAHPQLFLRTPPPQSQPVAALTPAPAPATVPDTPSTGGTLIPAQSVFSGTPDATAPAVAAPAPATAGSTTGTISPIAPPPAAKPAPAITTPAARDAPPQSRIAVSRGDNAAPRVNTAVSDAYAALESGRFDAARPLYEQALRGEPHNIDALLGLAAIAQHENRTDDASKYYLRILDIDPRHALAQTGLIALLGRADPQAAETRLKQLAARDPSPALYFTLGNLYADQGQWSQAQQAYFQSHHLEPGNPDYAYNLAVALEHLGQQKLALGFYRRALQLAAGRGRSNFNTAQAQTRITQLAARLE